MSDKCSIDGYPTVPDSEWCIEHETEADGTTPRWVLVKREDIEDLHDIVVSLMVSESPIWVEHFEELLLSHSAKLVEGMSQ